MRIHGPYISDEEVKGVADFLRSQKKPDYDTTILSHMIEEETTDEEPVEMDEKFDEAVEFICKTGRPPFPCCSASCEWGTIVRPE